MHRQGEEVKPRRYRDYVRDSLSDTITSMCCCETIHPTREVLEAQQMTVQLGIVGLCWGIFLLLREASPMVALIFSLKVNGERVLRLVVRTWRPSPPTGRRGRFLYTRVFYGARTQGSRADASFRDQLPSRLFFFAFAHR